MSGPGEADRVALARLDATVHGMVQGVGFRVWTSRTASIHGLRGWVRNEPDGSVRCVAEGARDVLEAFLGRLRTGPSGAVVARVDATFGQPSGEFDGFRIRSGAHPGD